MERIRRAPTQRVQPEHPQPARRAHDATLLAIHQQAGNRAVTQAINGLTVQRHEGPTRNEEVGAAPESAEGDFQPGTGTGTTAPAGAGLTGAARKKAIEDTLRASATGMWAMDVVTKWKLPVEYEYAGQGSYHQGGSIYINKNLGVGAAAIVMMHEAQHAATFKSGKQADRTKLSRAEYVKQSIADEAEGVVRQIEGLAVTTALGVDMTGLGNLPELKQRYLKVFYAKRDELTAANPTMSTAAVNAACRRFTRDGEVTKWFSDGTFVTSTDLTNYFDFYGKQWDDVNKAPGK